MNSPLKSGGSAIGSLPPPNALVQYTPKKVPLVHLLAHRAIVFLVAYGRLLPVDALHLFGERDPAGRHVFECGFLMDGSFACVARSLGLLFVDTCPPVATYKANTGQTSPFSAPNSVAPSWATGWLEARPLANELGRVRVNADRQRLDSRGRQARGGVLYDRFLHPFALVGFEFGSRTASGSSNFR
jgi:hypothetical protein